MTPFAPRAFLAILAIAGLTSACSTGGSPAVAPNWASTQAPAYGDAAQGPVAGKPGVATVVYFRGGDGDPTPVNAYVDDRYLTSVLRGGYSVTLACPGVTSLALVRDDATQAHQGRHGQKMNLQLQAGAVHYVKLGGTAPTTVPVGQFTEAAPRRQVHAVQRSLDASECGVLPAVATSPAVAKPAVVATTTPVLAAPVSKSFVLGTDGMFPFGKWEPEFLQTKGKDDLSQMAAQILALNIPANQLKVRVVAHADPVGDPGRNQLMSERRAASVRAALVAAGLPAASVVSEGKGDTQLLRSDCPRSMTDPKIREARNACNASNRRVEVTATNQ